MNVLAMRAAIFLREIDEDRIHIDGDGGGKNSAYRPTLQWATLMLKRVGIKSYRWSMCCALGTFPTRGTIFQAKKNPEILTFVGLPDFLNCYKNGGSCGIRTYDQLVKRQLDYWIAGSPVK
jgi:hypothetical protein